MVSIPGRDGFTRPRFVHSGIRYRGAPTRRASAMSSSRPAACTSSRTSFLLRSPCGCMLSFSRHGSAHTMARAMTFTLQQIANSCGLMAYALSTQYRVHTAHFRAGRGAGRRCGLSCLVARGPVDVRRGPARLGAGMEARVTVRDRREARELSRDREVIL